MGNTVLETKENTENTENNRNADIIGDIAEIMPEDGTERSKDPEAEVPVTAENTKTPEDTGIQEEPVQTEKNADTAGGKPSENHKRRRKNELLKSIPRTSTVSVEASPKLGAIQLKLPKIDEDYALTEAIKAMRTNIEFSGEENRAILLTSCLRDAGKSFVSLNLAISLAEGGKRVFYLDADLRKSVLIGRYRIKGQFEGLSHYLVGRSNIDSVIVTTNVRNLDMILAGHKPPNPSELLGSKRFVNLVRKIREVYDYVIIDTPPIGEVIDAAVIAKACDSAIMVTAFGHDSYRFVNSCRDQIEKSGCKVMGVIINKVPKERRARYGKYYGRYYGRYYGHYYGDYGERGGKKKSAKTSVDEEKTEESSEE